MKGFIKIIVLILFAIFTTINVQALEKVTDVKIKLLDNKGEFISDVTFNIYKGDCSNNMCMENNLVKEFTTTNNYTYITELTDGQYTIMKVSDNKNIPGKTLINIEDTTDEQVIILTEEKYDNIIILNNINDLNDIIYIYSSSGLLIDSFKGDMETYSLDLDKGEYYVTDSLNKIKELHFNITEERIINVKYNDQYISDSIIDLNKALIENKENDTSIEINTSQNESGTTSSTIVVDDITIENTVDVEVKVDWLTNTVNCPITSLSSTIKYILGTLILCAGICLVIINVKKNKNNI